MEALEGPSKIISVPDGNFVHSSKVLDKYMVMNPIFAEEEIGDDLALEAKVTPPSPLMGPGGQIGAKIPSFQEWEELLQFFENSPEIFVNIFERLKQSSNSFIFQAESAHSSNPDFAPRR